MTQHTPNQPTLTPAQPSQKKPFLAIAPDIDDDAIARLAAHKGVPSLTVEAARPTAEIALREPAAPRANTKPPRRPTEDAVARKIGAGESRPTTARTTVEFVDIETVAGPTPRARISYVKAGLPDYALLELKTRALHQKVSINHLILTALRGAGITIHDADLVEDGRRLRGKAAVLQLTEVD